MTGPISMRFFLPLAIAFIACMYLLYGGCSNRSRTKYPPRAEISDLVDVFHGIKVHDPYRWLENWDDPKVRVWSDQQNLHARSVLDALPSVQAIQARVSEIEHKASVSYYGINGTAHRLFALKDQPPLNQPLLVAMTSADEPGTEQVVLDLNKLDANGGTSIDWFVPAPDGKIVAVSLSQGGSEMGDLHLYRSEDGAELEKAIERVNGGTAGGDLAWKPDGSGFYYTRYPRPGERAGDDLNFFQQVWFHTLGTPTEQDHYVMGKELPRIGEIRLAMDQRSGHLLVTVQNGDSGRFAHYLIFTDGSIRQITRYEDQITAVIAGTNQDLYLISRKNAPRGKLLHLTYAHLELASAKTVIPEGSETIVSDFDARTMLVTPSRLILTYQLGGPSELRIFTHAGRSLTPPKVRPVSNIGGLTALADERFLFSSSSYIQAPAWYEFDIAKGTTRRTALYTNPPVDFSDTEVVREFAISKDGSKIPVNIILRKGTRLDGTHALVLNGYGGFGISRTPSFSSIRRIYIEQDVIYAIANIRGGAEFGEEWHRKGVLTLKQNGFDDFAAVMSHLIERKYTAPQRLAITGGSNGGLLMGAMITQHPDLFRATVSTVGLYDMIRSEQTPNGYFNIPEYGTVKDPEQFKALYAYSPYHRVQDGVAYPAVLFMTGANDPRVDPMHSRKMTARLQAATIGKHPVLLRTSSSTGHGMGTPLNEQIKEEVDQFAFLFDQLGVSFK